MQKRLLTLCALAHYNCAGINTNAVVLYYPLTKKSVSPERKIIMISNPLGSSPNGTADCAAETTTRKILVADDNDDIRDMLALLLHRLGHEVVVAADGETAVALAKRERPDLILMDVMMPRLSGLEAARKIYEIADLHTVPIVAISAFRNPLVEATSSGTFRWHAYLNKPVDPVELERVVASLIKK
ncbi:MAG: response regulator [Blastocatellia bacterium]|nr:response regulator [Blastocatellia bacterium]